jgi:hypothetical protein
VPVVDAKIPLYRSLRLVGWATVSGEDYDELVGWLWRDNGVGYACRYVDGRALLMHRQIMGLTWGDGLEVDHIDGNPLNNTRENLRLATRTQQMCKTRTRGAHGRGVSKQRNRYHAQGKINGKVSYLGSYATAAEAAAVAERWRREHHGDFAHRAPDGPREGERRVVA